MNFIQKYFAIIVMAGVVLAISIPSIFMPLKPYITYLLATIMLVIGLHLQPKDFVKVANLKGKLLVILFLKLTVTSIAAFIIGKIFGLSLTALIGLVIVGACPGGTASGVMALVGSIVAKHINTDLLKIVFAILLFGSGIWMILHNDNKVVKLPRSARYSIFGFCGILSVLASSTTFATMFFIKIGTDIKKAIAITSVCVLINSSVAAFVLTYGISINVPSTLGYLNIPLLVSSGIFALAGSLLAVNYLGIISPKLLKSLFIILMFVSGGVMII